MWITPLSSSSSASYFLVLLRIQQQWACNELTQITASLNSWVRVGLVERMTFKQRLEGNEEVSYGCIGERGILVQPNRESLTTYSWIYSSTVLYLQCILSYSHCFILK